MVLVALPEGTVSGSVNRGGASPCKGMPKPVTE